MGPSVRIKLTVAATCARPGGRVHTPTSHTVTHTHVHTLGLLAVWGSKRGFATVMMAAAGSSRAQMTAGSSRTQTTAGCSRTHPTASHLPPYLPTYLGPLLPLLLPDCESQVLQVLPPPPTVT